MRYWGLASLLICGLSALTVTGDAATAAFKPIYKVDSAAATVTGGKITIIASGAVSTGGWNKGHLRPRPPHKPADGILEFDFLATPPPASETVIQAFVPVTATLTMRLPARDTTQIKINAQSNSTTVSISR